MAISKEEVLWCYRMILGREPESEDIVNIHMQNKNITILREVFFNCKEFTGKRLELSAKQPSPFVPLGTLKNEIEYTASSSQLARCVVKIKEAWSHLGATQPHFSVLTDTQFLPENLDKNLDKFWASGETEAVEIEKMLVRHNFDSLSTKTCVEFGCGVGRVTMGLARRFNQVDAYDISQGHLFHAEQHSKELKLSNCRFNLCSDNILDPLKMCDFFYSRIVFQHNPPPVIYHLIRNALRALNPGGIAIFQVPTYIIGYHFSINEWITTDHKLDMQMHCLPQQVIFEIIMNENCALLEVREDNSTGALDRFVSNNFVVQRAIK